MPETRTCQGQHTALSVMAQAACVGSYFSLPSDPWFLGPHLPELFLSYTFNIINITQCGGDTGPSHQTQHRPFSSSITNTCPVRVSCHMAQTHWSRAAYENRLALIGLFLFYLKKKTFLSPKACGGMTIIKWAV